MNLDKLINTVLFTDTLTDEEKKDFFKCLINGNMERGIFIMPGVYLKRKTDEEIDCKYRQIEPSGMTTHGDTGWKDPNIILKYYAESVRKNQEKTGRTK